MTKQIGNGTITATLIAAFWHAHALDESRQEQVRARLRAAGYDGHEDDVAALERWHATQPAEHQRVYDIMDRAILGMMARPAEVGAIRTALAELAPHLGLAATDSPIVIIHTLQAAIATDDWPDVCGAAPVVVVAVTVNVTGPPAARVRRGRAGAGRR